MKKMKKRHTVYLEETKNGILYHRPNGLGRTEAVQHASGWDILAAVLQAVLLAGILLLAALWLTGARAETYYCTAESGLNLRWEPRRTAFVEALLPYGESIEVLEIDGHWAKVQYGDILWAYLEYLSTTPPSEEPVTGTIDANGRVAIREEPDGRRVGWLKPGAEVDILGTVDGWVRTDRGYVAAEYVAQSVEF